MTGQSRQAPHPGLRWGSLGWWLRAFTLLAPRSLGSTVSVLRRRGSGAGSQVASVRAQMTSNSRR